MKLSSIPGPGGDHIDSAPDGQSTNPQRLKRWLRAHVLVVVRGVVLAGALALLMVMVAVVYRPALATNGRAEQSVLRAATEGTVALLSYAPDTVAADIANAKSHLTGDFLTYYDEFTGQFVEPASRQRGVHNTARVVRSAVSEVGPNRAKVLVFINQETTTTDKPKPVLINSSVAVTMSKVSGRWLISAFDPNPV